MAEHREDYPPNYHPVRTLKHLGSVDPIKAAKKRRAGLAYYVGAGATTLLLVLLTAAGVSVVPSLVLATLGGCGVGLLFRHLPRIIDRVYDWAHHRRSRR